MQIKARGITEILRTIKLTVEITLLKYTESGNESLNASKQGRRLPEWNNKNDLNSLIRVTSLDKPAMPRTFER